MGTRGGNAAPVPRGRPPQNLLSGIAICGVCEAVLRSGSQNAGTGRGLLKRTMPSRYPIYECAGSAAQSGFHISIHREHADQIVTDAVLARIAAPVFQIPRALPEDEDGAERRALRHQIRADRTWLKAVERLADRQGQPSILTTQERIVLPKTTAARHRIDDLEKLDPLLEQLSNAIEVADVWARMSIMEQRHVVEALVTPTINPVLPAERGRRGLNSERVDLRWR